MELNWDISCLKNQYWFKFLRVIEEYIAKQWTFLGHSVMTIL